MDYLAKARLSLEIEHAVLRLNGIVSIFHFSNKFFIYTERFKEVESTVQKLFQNITNNLNTHITYELIRVNAGELMDRSNDITN
jgi:hypothetical protein